MSLRIAAFGIALFAIALAGPAAGLAAVCETNADCNDTNVCTTDSCNAPSCVFTPNSGPCDDGLFCNGADFCAASACIGHLAVPCTGPDGDADCAESCDEAADTCNAPDADGSSCNTSSDCTEGESCMAGVCTGDAVDCADDDECTEDVCDDLGGCRHVEIPNCPPTTTTTIATTTSTTLPPTTTLLETTTTSVTTTTLPEPLCGDYDGSGRVLTNDALLILRAAVIGGECELIRCDTSGDGAVRTVDALLALRIAVGILNSDGPCPVV